MDEIDPTDLVEETEMLQTPQRWMGQQLTVSYSVLNKCNSSTNRLINLFFVLNRHRDVGRWWWCFKREGLRAWVYNKWFRDLVDTLWTTPWGINPFSYKVKRKSLYSGCCSSVVHGYWDHEKTISNLTLFIRGRRGCKLPMLITKTAFKL